MANAIPSVDHQPNPTLSCPPLPSPNLPLLSPHLPSQVIEQGVTGTNFYIIKSGSVSVSIDGKEVKQLFSGDHFGERALLTEENTAASVTVRERTELWVLGKKDFEQMLGPLEQILKKERLTRERELEMETARIPPPHPRHTLTAYSPHANLTLNFTRNSLPPHRHAISTLQRPPQPHLRLPPPDVKANTKPPALHLPRSSPISLDLEPPRPPLFDTLPLPPTPSLQL